MCTDYDRAAQGDAMAYQRLTPTERTRLALATHKPSTSTNTDTTTTAEKPAPKASASARPLTKTEAFEAALERDAKAQGAEILRRYREGSL